MKLIAVVLCIITFTYTAFAAQNPGDAAKPQINKQISTNAWWSNKTAGLVGGIAGSVVGLMGAAIGTLTGIGIARNICLSLLGIMFVFGLVSLTVGLISLFFSQPYAVYYPLLLEGLLSSVLPSCLFRSIKLQYEQKELRKMHAMDAK
jgi:hypothetical protein